MVRVFEDDKCIIVMPMKILLIVGDASNVFSYNYAKWIKQSMECQIDVFDFYPTNSRAEEQLCFDNVYSAKESPSFYRRRYLRDSLYHSFKKRELLKFLEGRKYDIIHCHWLISPLVLCADEIKLHCNNLFATFWGGELTQWKIWLSQNLYLKKLDTFLDKVDFVIDPQPYKSQLIKHYPILENKFKIGNLGAVGLDYLSDLINNSSRELSKQYFGLPIEKVSVMIGYSGKEIHQHIPIIEQISQYKGNTENLHLLVPMTRDASSIYVEKVRKSLDNSRISYTLLSDRFLSDEEVAILRYATDIVLQLSKFDAFSRSIIEAFCAKSLVIYGDWLDYEGYLQADGFNGVEVNSIETGIAALFEYKDGLHSLESILTANSLNGIENNKWENCIKSWVEIYKSCL